MVEALVLVMLLAPVLAGVACALARYRREVHEALTLLATGVTLALSILLLVVVRSRGPLLLLYDEVYVDQLSAVFAATVALVTFTSALFSYDYMEYACRARGVGTARLSLYYALLLASESTMLAVCVVNNVFILWVMVEATTLASTLLVGFWRDFRSLEASWKYLLLCTVGITSALFGTAMVYSNILAETGDPYAGLLWTSVKRYVHVLSPSLLAVASALIVVGYGVKAGLAPFHWWLPDAYTEAPSPVSALISGVLTECAFYALLRWYTVLHPAIGSGLSLLLVVLGLTSIVISSPAMILQDDYKRLLAYSSVENMGIAALALGLGGGIGVYFSLLHVLAHGIIKSSLFLTSGHLEYAFGTRRSSEVSGVISMDRVLGGLLMASALALMGVPPSPLFYSELGVFLASVKLLGVVVAYAVFIMVAFAAVAYRTVMIAWGSPRLVRADDARSPMILIAQLALYVLVMTLGCLPQLLDELIEGCVSCVLG